MQVRENHHYLETALRAAIRKKDNIDFTGLCDLIHKKSSGASFLSLDEQGKSFLFLAIESGTQTMVNELLTLQGENEKILFAKDQKNSTLLDMAILRGSYSVCEQLIQLAEKQGRLEEYFSADSTGYTVLHHAANNPCSDQGNIIELLLEKISIYKNLQEFVNYVNEDGDTALHLALKNTTATATNSLMRAGANWFLHNNEGNTPFDLFTVSQEKSTEIFRLLDKDNQKILLKLYREFLIEKMQAGNANANEIDQIKNNLFLLAGIHSLKSLLLLQYEFGKFHGNSQFFPNDFSESDILKDKELINDFMTLEYGARPTEDTNADHAVMDKQRMQVVKLIKMFEDYQEVLNNMRPYSFGAIVISVASFFLYLPVYAGILGWLDHIKGQYPTENPDGSTNWTLNNANSKPHLNARINELNFGAFAFIFPFSALAMGLYFACKTEQYILPREWEAIIHSLKSDVLSNLQDLEQTDPNYLYTQPQNIRDLENYISLLETQWILPVIGSEHTPWQKLTDMKNIIMQILVTLKTIQKEMNLFQPSLPKTPILLFNAAQENTNPQVVIDLDDDGKEHVNASIKYSESSESDSECDSGVELLRQLKQ